MLCNICEFGNILIYSTGENCLFILKIVKTEETDDEYDMFMSGCNSTVCFCLNRRLKVDTRCNPPRVDWDQD